MGIDKSEMNAHQNFERWTLTDPRTCHLILLAGSPLLGTYSSSHSWNNIVDKAFLTVKLYGKQSIYVYNQVGPAFCFPLLS